jgi:hypothetical protein
MKKCILSLLSIVALLGLPCGNTKAQVRVIGHVSAELISALTASETSQLHFGRFFPETSGGQIVITPQGVRIASENITTLGIYSAASFYLTGQPEAAYSISLPFNPVTLTNVANSKTMTVDTWLSIPSAVPGSGVLTGGSQIVKVGATLHVGIMSDNPEGIYTGTYSISFDYN